jgi:hypothetical protein
MEHAKAGGDYLDDSVQMSFCFILPFPHLFLLLLFQPYLNQGIEEQVMSTPHCSCAGYFL